MQRKFLVGGMFAILALFSTSLSSQEFKVLDRTVQVHGFGKMCIRDSSCMASECAPLRIYENRDPADRVTRTNHRKLLGLRCHAD